MKVISFSELWKVKVILEGKANQTIRPLKIIELPPTNPVDRIATWSKPRFKVGEQAKLIFKQRSTPKGSWFCLKGHRGDTRELLIGDPWHKSVEGTFMKLGQKAATELGQEIQVKKSPCLFIFPKHFATVKLTSVFEIEMDDKGIGEPTIEAGRVIDWDKNYTTVPAIAKDDGFRSHDYMFDWFHKKYSLDTSKRFAVYRWENVITSSSK